MALTETPVTGQECKLYRNTGTHAAPVWDEIKKAINVNVNIPKGEADQSARESKFRMTRGALMDVEITFTYRKKQGADTLFDALVSAYFDRTAIEFAVMDASITEPGAQGMRAFCELLTMVDAQELEFSEEIEFTAKPTYHEEAAALVEPDWYVVPTP